MTHPTIPLPTTAHSDRTRRFTVYASYFSIAVIVIPVLALIGWAWEIELLKKLATSYVSMNPVTAICLILLGISTLLSLKQPVGRQRILLIRLLSSIAGLVGLLVLCRYVFGWDIYPDRLLFTSRLNIGEPAPNLMAPNSAVSFVLLFGAITSLDYRTKYGFRPSQYLAIIATCFALFTLLGYIDGSREFIAIKAFIPMAVNTAISLLLLSLAIIFARPREGLMATYGSETGAGYLLQRLLFVVVLLPALLGWIEIWGYRRGYFNYEMGVALNTAANIIIGAVLLWVVAFALYKKEQELDKTKDDFLNLATHQLQTPITGVKVTLQMLNDGVGGHLSKAQKSLIEEALGASEREARIVSDLLHVARVDSGKMVLNLEKCHIAKLIKDIVREQQATIKERGQTISVKTPAIIAEVDPSKVRMAIENLVSNASKYTPEGGKLWIEASNQDNILTIVVGDTGVGIADQDLTRLFTKFSRLHTGMAEDPGGTGLGLYLVKHIIELHGGTVSVTSATDQGSEFKIQLPLKQSKK